jgi:hypothetical protein
MSHENLTPRKVSMLDDDGRPDTPHLPKYLFWEVRHDTMDWRKASRFVVERILEYGQYQEWEEIIRFYGRRKVLHVLKKEAIYLMDCNIERACAYFKLKREELRCYWRKKERQGFWP